MSMYYLSIKNIIDKNKENSLSLSNYYIESAIEKLNSVNEPKYHSFLLFMDVCKHLETFSYSNKTIILHTINQTNDFINNTNNEHKEKYTGNENNLIILQIKETLFHLKMLSIRALILDLIDSDYSSDSQNFYKAEKWVFEIITEFENTFKEFHTLMKEFNYVFLNDCKCIFISKNKRFGYYGNLLLIDFMVYQKWSKKYFVFDFTEFFQTIIDNFLPDRLLENKELQKIIEENDLER